MVPSYLLLQAGLGPNEIQGEGMAGMRLHAVTGSFLDSPAATLRGPPCSSGGTDDGSVFRAGSAAPLGLGRGAFGAHSACVGSGPGRAHRQKRLGLVL